MDGLRVRITGTRVKEDRGYTCYLISVQKPARTRGALVSSKGNRTRAWVMMKRYTEFHALQTTLNKRHSQISDIPFPEKKTTIFGNLSEVQLEERRRGLEQWLRILLGNLAMSVPLDLQHFIREFLGANSRTLFTADLVASRITQKEYDALVKAEDEQIKIDADPLSSPTETRAGEPDPITRLYGDGNDEPVSSGNDSDSSRDQPQEPANDEPPASGTLSQTEAETIKQQLRFIIDKSKREEGEVVQLRKTAAEVTQLRAQLARIQETEKLLVQSDAEMQEQLKAAQAAQAQALHDARKEFQQARQEYKQAEQAKIKLAQADQQAEDVLARARGLTLELSLQKAQAHAQTEQHVAREQELSRALAQAKVQHATELDRMNAKFAKELAKEKAQAQEQEKQHAEQKRQAEEEWGQRIKKVEERGARQSKRWFDTQKRLEEHAAALAEEQVITLTEELAAKSKQQRIEEKVSKFTSKSRAGLATGSDQRL